MENPSLLKGTPKQSLQKWLRLNAVAYGLCDDEGKPRESAITEIAKIANWKTKGGAPSTPYAASLSEPASGSNLSSAGGKKLSLGEQKKQKNHDDFYIDLDDEIPFEVFEGINLFFENNLFSRFEVSVFVTYLPIKTSEIVDLDVNKSHGERICPTITHSQKLA